MSPFFISGGIFLRTLPKKLQVWEGAFPRSWRKWYIENVVCADFEGIAWSSTIFFPYRVAFSKAYDQHAKSKKHLQASSVSSVTRFATCTDQVVAKLRKELEKEMEARLNELLKDNWPDQIPVLRKKPKRRRALRKVRIVKAWSTTVIHRTVKTCWNVTICQNPPMQFSKKWCQVRWKACSTVWLSLLKQKKSLLRLSESNFVTVWKKR